MTRMLLQESLLCVARGRPCKLPDDIATSQRNAAALVHSISRFSSASTIVQEFRSGKSPIMLATDVAARGLGVQLPVIFMHVLQSHAARKQA